MERQGCQHLKRSAREQEASVRAAIQCVHVINEYHEMLAAIDAETGKDGSCPVPPEALAERAYEAETAMRVLTRHGLDAMNAFRDTGELHRMAGEAFRKLEGKALDFGEAVKECRRAGEKLGGPDLAFLDRLPKAVESLGLAATIRRGRPELTGKSVHGEAGKAAIEFAPRNGSLGRISTAQFFGARGGAERLATSVPVFSPETCHHRERLPGKVKTPITDAYSGVLAGMTSANQSMYRHARQVELFGRGGVKGNDPVTAILVSIVVIGIVCIVVGAATGNSYLAAFGVVLVLGAVCVAVGACTLLIAPLVAIVI